MLRVSSEFADVTVALDDEANGSRLRLEDAKTGQVRHLDALELESLVWAAPEELAALLDPSRGRWGDAPDPVVALARALYPALAAGNRDAVLELLADDFVGVLSAGLPAPIGGRHEGRSAMVDGWWAIGRRFGVRAEPSRWYPCGAGRLVVTGRYRGRHRNADIEIDAVFAHVWTSAHGRLASLHQITDTVAWGL